MALSLVDLFEHSVRRHRSRPALAVVGGPPIDYEQLDQRSAQLANALRHVGVRRGDRVALALPKSTEAVIAIWGILRAGAAYVPIEPRTPPSRAAFIGADVGVAAVVAGGEAASTAAAIVGALPRVPVLEAEGQGEMDGPTVVPQTIVAAQPTTPPARHVSVRDLAYVLYTSGSTGVPKGVMMTHGAALSFVEWAAKAFDLGSADVLANHAAFHFDISTFDVFGAAGAGAKLVVLDDETCRFPTASADAVESERITIWYSVPTALRRMLRLGGLGRRHPPALRAVLFAGEVYPLDELRGLQDALPGVSLANLYGPTETNVCTYWPVPALERWRSATIPIGFDCEGCEGVVVDDDLRPVPDGTAGELLVRGGTLMAGYWNDPERTAAALVPDFLYPHLGDRLYRTGDVVRRETDGTYAFIGRRDSLVKVRGYRVELGEVEAAIHHTGSVREAVVIATEREVAGEQQTILIAFVVTSATLPEDVTHATRRLRQELAQVLPRYMLPAEIRWLQALPLTATGKVDRRRLATIAASESDNVGVPCREAYNRR